MKKTIFLILFTGFLLSGYAQVPQAFSYKLQIKGNSGNPHANKKINLKISILQESADGSAVYIEKHQVNTSPVGIVDIEIGRGTPIQGLFTEIDWKNWPYFVKAELDLKCTGSYNLLAITELLTVPYAMLAGNVIDDNDSDFDPQNELISDIFLSGTNMNIVEGNQTKSVDLASLVYNQDTDNDPANELQHLVLSGPILAITKGNAVNLAESGLDTDPRNELQVISIRNDTIFLSYGGFAKLPAGASFSGDYNDLLNRPVIKKGDSNIAINDDALFSITSGKNNFASGLDALYSNNEGSSNIAIGNSSISKNESGNDNIANGYMSLYSNYDGNANIAMGNMALYSNFGGNRTISTNDTELKKFGSHNIALGANSLYNNMNGQHNIAFGYGSLYNNKGFDHITEARASFNNAFGYRALYNNIQGSYNIANGYQALYHNTGGYNTPNDSSGNYNIAVGFKSLYSNTIGIGNVAIGQYSGTFNRDGYYNTFIGSFANSKAGDLFNATAIGYNAQVEANNKIVLGNKDVSNIGGYATWTNYSDKRMKENIVYQSNLGLEFINRLKTVSFIYKADGKKRHRDGLIAQDVQGVLKILGLQFSGLVVDDDISGTLNLSYSEFVIPLINAVQQLDKKNKDEINALKSRNQQMQEKLDELNERIEKLELLLHSKNNMN